MGSLKFVLALTLILMTRPARAQDDATDAERSLVEDSRAQVASEIQLMAADLLDELVFQWTRSPVFESESPLVVAGISVPIGYGAGMVTYLENHLTDLLVRNPSTRLRLVHCPECVSLVTHSGQKGTVIARGLQLPEVLERSGSLSGAHHALFLDFEAEGAQLVLRARITALKPPLPVVYARSLSTSTTSPALLRNGESLKSAADARKEYLDVLRERGPFSFPIRVVVRTYAQPNGSTTWSSNPDGTWKIQSMAAIPPFVWFEGGIDVAFTQERLWSAEFTLGFSSLDRAHDAWLAGARLSRLISGRMRSLTRPDLYLYMAGSVQNIRGSDAVLFRKSTPSLQDALADSGRGQARSSFAGWRTGLEARLKNRVSLGAFLETLPTFTSNQSGSFGDFVDVGITAFQVAGMEVGFWF